MWLVREQEREEQLRKEHEAAGPEPKEEEPLTNDEYKISIWTRLYYNKIVRGLIVILVVAIMIPILILLFLDTTDPEFDNFHTCSMQTGYQVSCGVQNTTFEKCSDLKCCFNETEFSCFHKVRSYYQYTQTEETSNLYKPIEEKTPFGKNNTPVYLILKKDNSYTVSISLTTEENEKNYKTFVANSEYKTKVFTKHMAVEINRTKTNEQLLSTTRGPLIISDKYWEWTVDLFADHLFGMDFLNMPHNKSITKVIYKNAMDHSSVARFMSSSVGKFHGLEVKHSGPLEVTVTEAKLLVLRSFSGSRLTLRMVTGPTPVDVLRQFRGNEMWKPVPYWILGVHICRDGDVSNINKVLSEFNKFDKTLPYDSDCIHENLFSLSKNKGNGKINEAVKELKKNKKFIMSLAPQVLVENTSGSSYKKAEQLKILYTTKNKIVKGKYINKTVAYPDYSSVKAQQWFQEKYDTELSHLKPDGIVLRNNWPVNDNYKMNAVWRFQYMTKAVQTALSKTLPYDSINSANVQHIDVHNTYGLDYTNIVASTTQSEFILSSAYSLGSRYPAHVQNIDASWQNFKDMMKKTLSHSLFGGPLFSVPVCGDTKKFDIGNNQGVCMRWYLMAATMPLFRISSDIPRRDPSAYDDIKHVKNIMVNAIKTRYTLLPYYYTVLSENLPMVRPMFFNFPDNSKTFDLDEQYMIGEALLIAQPNIFPALDMQVYLPKIPGGWYEFWGGMKFPQVGWVTLPLVDNDLFTFIPAGKIVPLQSEAGNSAEETLKHPLKLVIALHCSTKDKITTCSAKGTLFSKNSIIIQFQANKDSLLILNAEKCATPDFRISRIHIYNSESMLYEVPTDMSEFCVKKNGNVQIEYSKLIEM